MILVPIVYKRSRLAYPYKYAGGILNPNKQYYVKTIQGNNNPMPILEEEAYKRSTQLVDQQ